MAPALCLDQVGTNSQPTAQTLEEFSYKLFQLSSNPHHSSWSVYPQGVLYKLFSLKQKKGRYATTPPKSNCEPNFKSQDHNTISADVIKGCYKIYKEPMKLYNAR